MLYKPFREEIAMRKTLCLILLAGILLGLIPQAGAIVLEETAVEVFAESDPKESLQAGSDRVFFALRFPP